MSTDTDLQDSLPDETGLPDEVGLPDEIESTDDLDIHLEGDEPEQKEAAEKPKLDPLEPAPKWDKRYKEVFAEWGQSPQGRKYQEAMLDLYNEQQGYATQLEQERSQLRPYYDQAQHFQQAIAPYEKMIAMSGAEPTAFVRQALGLTMQLQQDPRATIMRLAQGAGLDLNQLTQEQPYVDPTIQALQQQLQAMRRDSVQREERQAQEYAHRVRTETEGQLNTFANAKAESGEPLHPHLETVQDIMAEQIRGREMQRQYNRSLPPMSLEEAYERACKLSPEVEQQSAAEKGAKEAAEKAAKAKKAVEAGRRVAGKSTGDDNPAEASITAEIRKNWQKSRSQAA